MITEMWKISKLVTRWRGSAVDFPAIWPGAPVVRCAGAVVSVVFFISSAALAAVPVGKADSVEVHAGQKVRIAVLANDTGTIDASTVEVVSAPQEGTAAVQADGSILVTAGAENSRLTYRVSGPDGVSAATEVRVVVADRLRLAPVGFSVPSSPPATNWMTQNAFGSLRFTQPVTLASPPGDQRRLFVCQKAGLLRVVPDVAAAVPVAPTFLDLPEWLSSRGESLATSSEMGLLGIAFHPKFAANGRFFLFYSVEKPDGLNYQRLSAFQVDPADDGRALPESERVLLEQQDQAGNHNGGDLQFGPDGYLYVTLGDEGNQNDQLNNSQALTKDFFSGILRLDVDRKPGNLEPHAHPSVVLVDDKPGYSVPKDNPWVPESEGGGWDGRFNGVRVTALDTVRTEFWAVGLRNPWRISFDPETGDLWCGDVGGSQREEVNLITRGGNYGWAFREGTIDGPKVRQAPAGFQSIAPLYEYGHGSGPMLGESITGGVVYRGTRFPELAGQYVFADYSNGNIWALRRLATGAPVVVRLTGDPGIAGFGRDPSNGDILFADYSSGAVRRLVPSSTTNSFPQTLAATGLFADLSDLSPQPGLIPYEINRPFWSDHAVKRRWLALPGTTGTIGWTPEGAWSFPAGSLWVKHFDMEMVRGDAKSRRRIETRLLVRTGSGAYGVSYRWNAQGTDAVLAPDEGVDIPLTIKSGAQTISQSWRIPSRAECLACHTSQAGHALSSTTRQFNRDGVINGFGGNQLKVLAEGGYFSTSAITPNVLPRHSRPGEEGVSLESQVRSWLAVNCSYCHQSGGTAPAGFDVRPELTLEETGLIGGAVTNNGGDPAARLILPGDPDRSVVLQRVAASNGFTRMPAIGSSVVDPEGVALLTEWVGEVLPDRQDWESWTDHHFGSSTGPERDPDSDPDGDGYTNEAEFTAATDPLKARHRPEVDVSVTGDEITLRFNVPENRSWQVEWSAGLGNWQPWDIPGNNGVPSEGGILTIRGPVRLPHGYHRVRLRAQ